ncbi:UNVERIFIED_CONTAM: hypothetical protein Slati_1717100 [Sesamum latifolium]|uniref:Uncharacterized protein n=1 Tax=Sesamum latifolium TaxID=2727402 RepID=A0AAW2WZR4_9LAMI
MPTLEKRDREAHSKWIPPRICMLGEGSRNWSIPEKRICKSKVAKNASSEALPKGDPKNGPEDRVEPGDPPCKGVIRMIAGGPIGGDSCHTRKAEVRKVYDATIKEVLDVEAVDDAPIIQFGRAEHFKPRNSHNDALVITALLANYEVGYIFIDSGSSTDILFGEVYDQMQLGNIPLEKVNTSLYGFTGEVVHPQGMISLPLRLGMEPTRKTRVLKFLVVDVPSPYNVILGRPTLNAFQAIISLYNMKIKFPTLGGVGEVQGDPLQSRKCYVEAVRKGQKRNPDEVLKEAPSCKQGKEEEVEQGPETEKGTPPKVQPIEEQLNIELILGDPDKTTRIDSRMNDDTRREIIQYLQLNIDIVAWTPQDLKGIDPKVITHDLNIDPHVKPVNQKKMHFGPEKDKIIQAEVDKLMAAGHIEELQF